MKKRTYLLIGAVVILLVTLLGVSLIMNRKLDIKADSATPEVLLNNSFPYRNSFDIFHKFEGTIVDNKTITLAKTTGGQQGQNKTIKIYPNGNFKTELTPVFKGQPTPDKKNWELVSEPVADDDASYVSIKNDFKTDLYTHDMVNIPANSVIHAVTVKVKTLGAPFVGPRLFINDQEYSNPSGQEPLTSGWRDSSYTWIKNPDGNDWKPSDINNLKFGAYIGVGEGTAKMTQVYAEVTYSETGQYVLNGTATLEGLRFINTDYSEYSLVNIKNVTIGKIENGGTVEVKYSRDGKNWIDKATDLGFLKEVFIKVTMSTTDSAKTPVLNKISIDFVEIESPQKPVAKSPVNNSDVSSFRPELIASDYKHNKGIGFVSSEWELATDPALKPDGSFNRLVSGFRTTQTPSTSYTPNFNLTKDKKYYWHVRYLDLNGFKSPWSDVSSFTVKFQPKIVKPNPILYSGLNNYNMLNPIVIQADFNGAKPDEVYWKIKSDSKIIIQEKVVGFSDQYVVQPSKLKIDTPYKVSVAYKINGYLTPYSPESYFWMIAELEYKTLSAENVTQTTALLNGEITSAPGITAKQYVFYAGPFGSSARIVDDKIGSFGVGKYSYLMKKLEPNTLYRFYFCASKLSSAVDTATCLSPNYISFKTLPLVKTLDASDVKSNSVVFNGEIVSLDGNIINRKGFLLCTNPKLSGCTVLDNNLDQNTGKFSNSASNLTPDTTYYYSAFVRLDSSTNFFYGEDLNFKTPPIQINTVKIHAKSSLYKNSGAHFNVLVDGVKIGDKIAATSYADYTFSYAGTPKNITIQYDNDASGFVSIKSFQDRNLFVDQITVNGKVYKTATQGKFHAKTLTGPIIRTVDALKINGFLIFGL